MLRHVLLMQTTLIVIWVISNFCGNEAAISAVVIFTILLTILIVILIIIDWLGSGVGIR